MTFMRRASLGITLAAAIVPGAMMLRAPLIFAQAAHPATAPEASPSSAQEVQKLKATRLDSPTAIRRAFAALADADEDVRQAARSQLLGLSHQDLPFLEQVVKESPVHPSQAAALHEIVTHVFLTGQSYPQDMDHGFLGIRFAPPDVGEDGPNEGVEVFGRLPGFVAFRELQDGDILLSIVGDATHPPAALHFRLDVSQAVNADRRAGDVVVFEVLRHGRRMRIALKLDPRPLQVTQLNSEDFVADRIDAAETYWNEHFARLLPGPVL